METREVLMDRSQENRVDHNALEKVVPDAVQMEPGRWAIPRLNGRAFGVCVQSEHDWLLMSTLLLGAKEFRRYDADQVWRLLCGNAVIPGGVKFAASGDASSLYMRSEIPLQNGMNGTYGLSDRIRDACKGFDRAHDLFCQTGKKPAAKSDVKPPAPADLDGKQEVSSRLTEAGWHCVMRADGTATVTLDVFNASCQASVCILDGVGVRAWVDLDVTDDLNRVSRKALGLYLLAATGMMKMVRAAAGGSNGSARPLRLEAVSDASSGHYDLNHVLSALSCAAGLCAREVGVFNSERLAREYLSMRGWTP